MKKLIVGTIVLVFILCVFVFFTVMGPIWAISAQAGEREDLQQKLGANVAQAQKLAVRQQAIQAELGKIPKVMELSKENNEIQAKLQKLGEENQAIIKKLDGLK
jgi:predicted nuclease with TOPRIM domain